VRSASTWTLARSAPQRPDCRAPTAAANVLRAVNTIADGLGFDEDHDDAAVDGETAA
jgi:hypothetical protein